MKYSELKRSLQSGAGPVYILCGSDDFLRSHAVKLITDKCVSMPELNYLSVDGENMSGEVFESVFTSLRSYPFLSDKRAVLIREYYPSADELKRNGLADYIGDPQDTSVLIVSNKKECKALDKTDAVKVDCTSDLTLCMSWICNEAKKANLVISPQVAEAIAKFCLLDFTKINSEIAKLIDYCSGNGAIDMAAVNAIVHKDSEYKIYEMVENISASRYDEAYAIIKELLDKNESEQKLFVSIYSHFRRMLMIAVSDGTNAELAELLGVKEYSVKMTRQQLKRFPVAKLKEICERLADYDSSFKAGDTSLGNALWNGVFGAMIN